MSSLIYLDNNYIPRRYSNFVLENRHIYRNDFSEYITDNTRFACIKTDPTDKKKFRLYVVLIPSGNFYPLLRDTKDSGMYWDVNEALQHIFTEKYDTPDKVEFTSRALVTEYLQPSADQFPLLTIKYRYADEDYKETTRAIYYEAWEATFDNVYMRFFNCQFNFSEPKYLLAKYLTSIEFPEPPMEQIWNNNFYTSDDNYPAGIRQVVISPLAIKAVPVAFRGRQLPWASGIIEFLTNIKREFQDGLVEITLVNAFNSQSTITMRVDISSNLLYTNVYVKIRSTEQMLYGALRYPINMLEVVNISKVMASSVQAPTNLEEFEDAMIYPNCAMFAAMLGGGALSGLGQGLGTWAQSKQQQKMQDDMIAWYKQRQKMDFGHDLEMQNSMFQFQASRLNQEQHFSATQRQYDREQQKLLQAQDYINKSKLQESRYDNETLMQHNLFDQQLHMQDVQNKFTKELVETNLDSDIRKARNAQQLAGFRTSAAVTGLQSGTQRGGFGHPDAPQGAYLMPRSVSVQTDLPNVYTTRPTGYYTGPLSSN